MIIVLRPFKIVETVSTNNLGLSVFDQVLNHGEDQHHLSKGKKLVISEVDPRSLIRPDPYQQMMVMVEQTRTKMKIFHICDAYDIASIRAQRENETAAGGTTNRSSVKSHSIQEEEIKKEDGHYGENPLLQQSAFVRRAHAIPGSL